MGYDLTNKSGGYVRFTGSGWDLALAVARHYGWKPAGIPKPANWDEKEYGPWEDEYWINAGQEVSADDAASLASALTRAASATDALPTIQALRNELISLADKSHPVAVVHYSALSDDDAEGFRKRVMEFAEFAGQGPFLIE
jgi:hypothetical protein